MSTPPEQVPAVGPKTLATWSTALADAGGPNTLIWGVAPTLGIDLVTAHPGGVAKLLSGQPVQLRDLVRAPSQQARARQVLTSLADRHSEMSEDWGLAPIFVTSGTATWRSSASGRPAAPVVLRPAEVRLLDHHRQDVEVEITGAPEVNPALLRFLDATHGIDLDAHVLAGILNERRARTDDPLLRHIEEVCAGVPGFSIARSQGLAALTYSKDVAVADLVDLGESTSRPLALMAAGQSLWAKVRTPTVPEVTPAAGVTRAAPRDLDPDHLRVLDLAAAGHDLLVSAIPGTGRSSLRTALAADEIARGGVVLLVAADTGVRREFAEVLQSWADTAVPAVWEVARTRTEQLTQHERLLEALEALLAGGPADSESAPTTPRPRQQDLTGVLETVRARSLAMYRTREPWGLSVNDMQQRLAALADLPIPPSCSAQLTERAVRGIGVADLPGLQREITDLATHGAWSVRSHDDPWFGTHIDSTEDANRALALVRRLSGGGLQRLRDQVVPVATALGVPTPSGLDEARSVLRLAVALRAAQRQFRPEVFTADLDAMAAAHGTPQQRGAAGLSRLQVNRLRAAARRLVPTKEDVPPEGLGRALASARDTREALRAWPGRDKDAAMGRMPEELDAIAEEFTGEFEAIQWFQSTLSGTIAGDDLMSPSFEELQSRFAALARRPERAMVLPDVSARWRSLTARGLGPMLQELARRAVPAERTAEEVERMWALAVLQHLRSHEPVLGLFDRATATGELIRLEQMTEQVQQGAQAEVQQAVQRARAELRTSRRAARLAEAAAREGPWSLAQWWERSPEVMRALTPIVVASPWTIGHGLPGRVCSELVIVDELTRLTSARAAGALARGRTLVGFGDPVVNRAEEPRPSDPDRTVEDVPGPTAWETLSQRVPTVPLRTAWRAMSDDLFPTLRTQPEVVAVPGQWSPSRRRVQVARSEVPDAVWLRVRSALNRSAGTWSVLVAPPTDREAHWWAGRLGDVLTAEGFGPGLREMVRVEPWHRADRTTADVVLILADGHGDVLAESLTQRGSAEKVLPVMRRARWVSELLVTQETAEQLTLSRLAPGSAGRVLVEWFAAPPASLSQRHTAEAALPALHSRFVQRLRGEGLAVRVSNHPALGPLLHLAPGRDRLEVTTAIFDRPMRDDARGVDAHVRLWPQQLERAGWAVERVWADDIHADTGQEAMRVATNVLRSAAQGSPTPSGSTRARLR